MFFWILGDLFEGRVIMNDFMYLLICGLIDFHLLVWSLIIQAQCWAVKSRSVGLFTHLSRWDAWKPHLLDALPVCVGIVSLSSTMYSLVLLWTTPWHMQFLIDQVIMSRHAQCRPVPYTCLWWIFTEWSQLCELLWIIIIIIIMNPLKHQLLMRRCEINWLSHLLHATLRF